VSIQDLIDPEVVREIAQGDQMNDHPESYFVAGRDALRLINVALASLPPTYPGPQVRRILDLPCGHGRVMRYLRAGFPEAELVGCDILTDGVDFCAETFGAVPVYSDPDPARIKLEGKFDLIWCGSLFTHIDSPAWLSFLDLFEAHLAENGVALFTTHGRRAGDLLDRGATTLGLTPRGVDAILEEHGSTGFGYHDYPGQNGYGISLATPEWVCAEVTRRPGWRLTSFTEMGWVSFQDVAVCVRRPIEGIIIGGEAEELQGELPRTRGSLE
jgi:SAM-dependent methyltransferase